jgi:hypothetical protein
VLFHLLLKLETHFQLVLAYLHLNGIFFLLELLCIMQDNFCPIIGFLCG